MKTFIATLVLATSSLHAHGNHYSIAPQHVEKDPKIVQEADQTDIFAIPLDEDAEDQQEELYQLEHPSKNSRSKW
jgi:hypothetical protein